MLVQGRNDVVGEGLRALPQIPGGYQRYRAPTEGRPYDNGNCRFRIVVNSRFHGNDRMITNPSSHHSPLEGESNPQTDWMGGTTVIL